MYSARSELQRLRDNLYTRLLKHRLSSTVFTGTRPDPAGTPEYKNPHRWGWDKAFIEVIADIDARILTLPSTETAVSHQQWAVQWWEGGDPSFVRLIAYKQRHEAEAHLIQIRRREQELQRAEPDFSYHAELKVRDIPHWATFTSKGTSS